MASSTPAGSPAWWALHALPAETATPDATVNKKCFADEDHYLKWNSQKGQYVRAQYARTVRDKEAEREL